MPGQRSIVPLLPAQQMMLAATLKRDPGTYVQQLAFQVNGTDWAAIQTALTKLIGAYEGFRSVVLHEGLKQAVWVCSESTYPTIKTHTASDGTETELLQGIRQMGFVIQKEPCIRFDWIETTSRNILAITNHHLLFDGWGKQQLLRDFMRLVEHPQHFLPEKLNRQWYDGWSKLDHGAAIQAYSEYVQPFSSTADLTTHPSDVNENGVVTCDIPRLRLDKWARKWGLTPAEAMNFVWACFVSEWTQEPHVQFGVVKQTGLLSSLPNDFGLGIQTLPCQFEVDREAPMSALVQQFKARERAIAAFPFANPLDTTFSRLRYTFLIAFENYPLNKALYTAEQAFELIHSYDYSEFPLSLAVTPEPENYHLDWHFHAGTHSLAQIESLSSKFGAFLKRLTSDEPERLADVSLSQAFSAGPSQQGLLTPDSFFVQIEQHLAPSQRVIYDHLVAQFSMGIRRIWFYGDKHPHLPLIISAAWKMEVEVITVNERETDQFIASLQNIKPPDSIFCAEIDASLDGAFPLNSILDWQAPERPTAADKSDSLSRLCICTSGTTGEPKVVQLSLENLLAFFTAWDAKLPWREHEVFAAVAHPAFDVGVAELIFPLWKGWEMRFIRKEDLVEDALDDVFADITVFHLVPVLLESWIERKSADDVERFVMTGGDKVPQRLQRLLHAKFPTAKLFQYYGPSECTVFSAGFENHGQFPADKLPLGSDFSHAQNIIIGRHSQELPAFQEGEIAITGAAVGIGYAGGMTTGAFTTLYGIKAYRTGDVGWKDHEGNLFFRGRMDHQIKIHGQRIQLTRIERALEEWSGLSHWAVIYDAPVLAAFVMADGVQTFPPKARLGSALPAFAIPGVIETLSEFPLNKNGKIDVPALSARLAEIRPAAAQAALAPEFRSVFQDLFPGRDLREDLGWYSNGLNSVDALKFAGRIKKTLEQSLSMDQILMSSALTELPQLARAVDAAKHPSRELIQPGTPVHSAAARMFFLGESDPDSQDAYWIRTGFELSSDLATVQALEKWVGAQPAFSLGVHADGGAYRWTQSAPVLHLIQAKDAADFVRQVDGAPAPDFSALTHAYIAENGNTTWFALNVFHGLLDGLGVQQLLDTLASDFKSKTTTALDVLTPLTEPVDTAFWKPALQSVRIHKLPFTRLQPPSRSCSYRKALEPAERQALRTLQKTHNCSAFEAGFILWMQGWYRYFPDGDFATGVVVNTRQAWDEKQLEAMSVNMLPIPVQHDDPTEILAQWRSISEKFRQPFSEIAKLETQKQTKGTPFFNTTYTYNSWSTNDHVKALPFEIRGSAFDLSLDFIDTGEEAWFQWEFDPALFSADAVGFLHNALFQSTVESRPPNVVTPVSPPLATEWERIVREFRSEEALMDGREVLTFEELNARMTDWFERLEWSGSGILPIIAERTVDHIALIMTCLTRGIPFIPIDVETPPDRIAHIESLCGQPALNAATSSGNISIRPHRDFSKDLAYAIATSGSTGQPKLVGVKRSGYEAAIGAWAGDYGITPKDKSLQAASFSFDVFLGDLGRSLFQGSALVVLNAVQRKDPAEIARQLVSHRITVFETTPLVVRWWMEEPPFTTQHLRLLIVGSDAWKIGEMQALQTRVGPDVQVISSYGLSETTIDNSFFTQDPERSYATGLTVPIGRAMQHSTLVVADASGNPLPTGAQGLLAIGGPSVGKGYYQTEGWSHSGVIWMTADRGALDEYGNFHFHGRADYQVKIRGQRLELQAIESILQTILPEYNWIAFAFHNGYAHELGVACEKELDPGSIRRIRESILKNHPAYYLPSQFLCVPSWPMTSNGKIDRNALAEQASAAQVIQTGGAQSTDLLDLFNRLFGRKASHEDNFFALGLSSFDAMHFIREWNRQDARRLEVYHVFACETFGSLAALIQEREDGVPTTETYANSRQANRAQEAIWVDMMDKDDSLYNLPQFVRIPTSESQFKAIAEATLKSCPDLFVRFETTANGTLMQHRVAMDDYSLAQRELTRSEFDSFRKDAYFRSLPLHQGPAFEAELLQVEGEMHLYFNPHHLVFDGGSDEHLATIYQAIQSGREIEPAPVVPSPSPKRADWRGYFELGNLPTLLKGKPANRMEQHWVEALDKDVVQACRLLQTHWKVSGAVVYGLLLGEALHQSGIEMPWISLVMDTRSVPSVGMHMRAFPFPTGIAWNWAERAGRGKEALRHLFEHQHANVVYPDGIGHAAFHQVGLVVQHPVNLAAGVQVGSSTSRPRLPLTLYLETINENVFLRWEFDSGYFSQSVVQELSQAFSRVLNKLAESPVVPAPFRLHEASNAQMMGLAKESEAPWRALWNTYVPDPTHSHFFHGGGTSLKALLFLKALKETQDLNVPPAAFFRTPNWETIGRYAALSTSRQDLFWELQSGEGPEPKEDWYFPPIMGLGLVFNTYPKPNGHRSIAFNYPASLGEQTPYDSIEGLADLLLAAYQSMGPLPRSIGQVVAYSMGGIVAFEVIKRLEQAGTIVESLVIWDKPAQKFAPLPSESITTLRPALTALVEQLTEDDQERVEAVSTLLKHENLIEQYHQQGKVHCPIHVYHCPDGFDPQTMEDWQEFSSESVTFESIATEHDEIPAYWQKKGAVNR